MKLEHLAIIFVVIILPIMLVLSEYVENRITMAQLQITYDEKLLTATYDAVKAFQINTVSNSYSDATNSKVEDIEAAAKTFYNMAATNFNFNGYRATVMQEYVPALVFTLYDGYYIYGPFENTLTGIENPVEDVSEDYQPGKREGLKTYVYYSCRYKKDNNYDFVVTYSLDNYITVQGIVDGEYVNKSGYLMSGITQSGGGTSYQYDGIAFSKIDKEQISEYINEEYDDPQYSYVKINGTKYYLDPTKTDENVSNVFSMQPDGTRNYTQIKYGDTTARSKYNNAIQNNISAFKYYEQAYEFTNWVNEKLSGITTGHAVETKVGSTTEKDVVSIKDYFGTEMKIFTGNYQYSGSNFDEHRKAVIRHSIETNLSVAIASFSSNAGGADFIMPKISEEDWNIVQNNACIISFLQGIKMGSRKYNGYAVVQNSLSREYVDENDIYILGNDNRYYKANDKTLTTGVVGLANNRSSGRYKLDFEMKSAYKDDGSRVKFCPLRKISATSSNFLYGSYTSIVGSSGISGDNAIETSKYKDMYTYMENPAVPQTLKAAYFTALGRERWGAYHVNNEIMNTQIDANDINKNLINEWFLQDYS